MAQAKRSTSQKRTNGTSRSGNSRGKSSASAKKQQPKQEVVEVGFGDYWHAFTKTRVFLPIMTVVITAVLIGLDLLIAWNDYGRFFMFLGIEVIAAAIVWLIVTVYSFNSDKNRNNGDEV